MQPSVSGCYQTTYKELKPTYDVRLVKEKAGYQTTYKELKLATKAISAAVTPKLSDYL